MCSDERVFRSDEYRMRVKKVKRQRDIILVMMTKNKVIRILRDEKKK